MPTKNDDNVVFWTGAIGAPLIVAFLMVLSALLYLYQAYFAVFLWRWYMVPIFHLPELSMWQLAGVIVTINILHIRASYHEDKKAWKGFITGLLSPPVMLAIGWFIK